MCQTVIRFVNNYLSVFYGTCANRVYYGFEWCPWMSQLEVLIGVIRKKLTFTAREISLKTDQVLPQTDLCSDEL